MDKKKLTTMALVLMIFTSVYGFTNVPKAFFLMGYSSIIWYLLSGILFFIPYAFMLVEFGAAFKHSKGGIYSWMAESFNPKFAFIGIFMWYASYVIWMVNVGAGIWIPMSYAIFGADKVQNFSMFGLDSVKSIGILGILLIIGITYISIHGLEKVKKFTSIGGSAVALVNIIILLLGCIVLMKNGHLAQPFKFSDLFYNSPNLEYHKIIPILSFVVFAVFAFGGLEVVGGLVDETENPEKTLPKAIIGSSLVIIVGYSTLIFVMGMFTNWEFAFKKFLPAGEEVNLANVSYVAIKNLGYQLGLAFGASDDTAMTIGAWISRYFGISMFLALGGAFFAIIYSPLKQMIEGTPKELWPSSWEKINKHGMPSVAMIYQGVAICVIIFIVSFGGSGAKKFFDMLISMTNVAMTLPYMFIAYSFIHFKRKTEIKKPIEFFKSVKGAEIAVWIVLAVVGFANLFTIINPAIKGDFQTAIYSIVGPVIFSIFALVLYKRYEKKTK